MGRILMIVGDGSSCGHVDYGYNRMKEEGYEIVMAAPEKRPLQGAVHQPGRGVSMFDLTQKYVYEELPGYTLYPDASLDEIDVDTFDGLLLPGARAPEYLRNLDRVNEVVRHFVDEDKPIGAICHGPGLLLSAGVTGRRMVSVEGIKFEVIDSGNTYVDVKSEPVVDGNILTVWRTPYYHVWTRAFLAMLKERGILPNREPQYAQASNA
jgi:protease I